MNLFPKWWIANVKLIRTIDSCESYEQLNLISKWVHYTVLRYKIYEHIHECEPTNPIKHLERAFSKFPPKQE
jgi:hypothetical protein